MTIEKQAKICFTSSINKAKTKNGSKVWRTWRVKIRPCEKTPLGLYIDHVEYTLHESFETPRIGKNLLFMEKAREQRKYRF